MKKLPLIVAVFITMAMLASCGNNTPDNPLYEKVDGVGWRIKEGVTFQDVEEKEFKMKCSEPLDFSTYNNNPEKYEKVLYAATGTIEYAFSEKDGGYLRDIGDYMLELDNGDRWLISTQDTENRKIGDRVTVYGVLLVVSDSPEFVGVSVCYINER